MQKLLTLLFVVMCVLAVGQTPYTELLEKQQKHDGEALIYTEKSRILYADIIDNELRVTLEDLEETMLLDEKASFYAEDQVYHSTFHQVKEIEAYTLVPTTKKYKKLAVEEFKEKDDLSGYIFHDDTKIKVFNFPGLVKGAKRHLEYTTELKEPGLLSGFYFGGSFFMEKSVMELRIHPDVEMGYELFHTDSIDLKVEERVDSKGYKIISFTATDLKELPREGGTPDFRYFTPHVLFFIKEYSIDGETIPLMNDVEGLHSFYNKFLEDINVSENAELKALTDSIVSGEKTELEKVKSIYQWVQSNIKYVAFEDGYGGFIPRQAEDIYRKRYGDCKDMASIIHEMMEYAEIDAYWTWIGSRKLPYKYTDIASPAVDNHMICTFKNEEGYLFLDGTSSNIPFGMPSSFIQGKQALVHFSEDSFDVAEVPVVAFDQSMVEDSAYLRLDGEKITGSARASYTGYHRDKLIYVLSDHDKNELDEVVKSYHQKGSNKFQLTDFSTINKEDKDLPYHIDYNFTVDDYVTNVDDDIYININLERNLSEHKLEKDRKLDYEIDYKYGIKNTFVLEIPSGYKVSYKPPNSSFENDQFGYDVSYEEIGNQLKMNMNIRVDFLILDKQSFKEWNRFIKSLNDNYTQAVQLSKF